MNFRLSSIAHLICAGALIGCAAPKDPADTGPAKAVPKPESTLETPPPAAVDDGFRVGNLTEDLPKEAETRSTLPGSAAGSPGSSAVIVSPPSAPPPKPKSPPVAE